MFSLSNEYEYLNNLITINKYRKCHIKILKREEKSIKKTKMR